MLEQLSSPALGSFRGSAPVCQGSSLLLALVFCFLCPQSSQAQGYYDPYASDANQARSQQSLVPENQRQAQMPRQSQVARQYYRNDAAGAGQVPRGYQQYRSNAQHQSNAQGGYSAGPGYGSSMRPAPHGYQQGGYQSQRGALPRGAMRSQSVSGQGGPRGNFLGLGSLTSAAAVIAQTANQAWQFGDQLVQFKREVESSYDRFQQLKKAAEGLEHLNLRDIDGVFQRIDNVLTQGQSLGYSLAGSAQYLEEEYSNKYPVLAEQNISKKIQARLKEAGKVKSGFGAAEDAWDDSRDMYQKGKETYEAMSKAYNSVGEESMGDIAQGNFNVLQNLREHGAQIRKAREDLMAFQKQARNADTRQKADELQASLAQYQIQEQQLQRQVLMAMAQQNSKWQNFKMSMGKQVGVSNRMAFAQAIGTQPELSQASDYEAAPPSSYTGSTVSEEEVNRNPYQRTGGGQPGWVDKDGDGIPDGWDEIYKEMPEWGFKEEDSAEDDSGNTGSGNDREDPRNEDCPRTNYYGECIQDDGHAYMRSGEIGNNAWGGN